MYLGSFIGYGAGLSLLAGNERFPDCGGDVGLQAPINNCEWDRDCDMRTHFVMLRLQPSSPLVQ